MATAENVSFDILLGGKVTPEVLKAAFMSPLLVLPPGMAMVTAAAVPGPN